MSLNLQDPLLRLTGIHPRQTGGPLFCQILTDFARGGRRANSTPGPARGSYSVWQSLFQDMKNEVSSIEFFQGLPTREDLDQWNIQSGHKVIILDDLLQKAAKNVDIVELFCQYSHHLNFSVFFVVQNLFAHGKYFRTISLYTQYFILLKQNRDQSQLLALAKQAFPGQVSFFMDAYRKATQNPFGYLFVDLHPKTLHYKLDLTLFQIRPCQYSSLKAIHE